VEELLRAQWHAAMEAGPDDGRSRPAWTASDDALTRLLARYREPHRQYHSVAHLASVLTTAEELIDQLDVADPAAVRLALFFHDAIYDPRSATNEAASATLAREVLGALGQPGTRVEVVAALVAATADHEPPPDVDPTAAAIVLDADLAILSAGPAQYSAYLTGVRAEYGHVDDQAWRTGRSEVLRRLLARPVLYRTGPMRSREARARANLAAELTGLTG
jgi:predicted metal-dependent HD superfamily phosphohydrolase